MSYPSLDGASPIKIELFGRKKHRHPYWTYIGPESVQHLKVLPARGMPYYGTVLMEFKAAAMRLFDKGLIKNGDRAAWHPHALRHSFATECKHAKVDAEVREFMLGHEQGIVAVYVHQTVHPENVLQEYKKVMPYLSLEPSRVSLEENFNEEKKSWITEIAALRREIASLRESQQQKQTIAR